VTQQQLLQYCFAWGRSTPAQAALGRNSRTSCCSNSNKALSSNHRGRMDMLPVLCTSHSNPQHLMVDTAMGSTMEAMVQDPM
jgi:hypothetical protein